LGRSGYGRTQREGVDEAEQHEEHAGALAGRGGGARGRGFHSSTFRLNVNAFCGIGAAFRGCFTCVCVELGDIRGCLEFIKCQKRLRLS
jgi:hypothetical protein